MILLTGVFLLIACSQDKNEVESASGNRDTQSTQALNSAATDSSSEPSNETVIIIGNLTDKTGPSAQAMQFIDLALKDAVKYYNDNNLIPGVKLTIKEYDTQYSPGKLIPGYEWVKSQGADVIVSFLPIAPAVLDASIDEDELVFFTANVDRDVLYPPGYMFAWACFWEEMVYTQLNWIAENHWDYVANGPAIIGGAGWDDGSTSLIFKAAKEYARVHPEQFTWTNGYLTDFTFTWKSEVEGLKDCDYIFVPALMHTFTTDYTKAGHSKATFLASEPQTAFLGLITDSGRWNEIDGTLFAMNARWWDQEMDEFHAIARRIITASYPHDSATIRDIKQSGRSYITVSLFAFMCDIIKTAAENVGPENLDSQAIYEAAQNFSFYVDNLEWANFSPTKRNGYNYFIMSKADEDSQTLVTISDWLPVQKAP